MSIPPAPRSPPRPDQTPLSRGCFIEDTLGQVQLRDLLQRGMAAHADYGNFLLDHGAPAPCQHAARGWRPPRPALPRRRAGGRGVVKSSCARGGRAECAPAARAAAPPVSGTPDKLVYHIDGHDAASADSAWRKW